ncbi:hypothetical protein GCM10009744_10270 [Kribbella alba]|uniref:Uncharacterized protein n=1 Tax=Kribbella alba TaxID=190197 RepID=A0ABP4QW54_9ACTN
MHQLVESRETHVRLELHTGGPQHPGSLCRRPGRSGIQEHRLADARVSGQEQTTAADSGGGDEAAKLFEFSVATEQSRGRSPSL